MSKKRETSRLYSANEVLHSLFQNSKDELAVQFKRWKLWQYWPQIVGKTMSSRSTPVSFYKGTLYIWVDSSVRLQEMTFMIKPIREKINNYLGSNYVRSIRLTLDRKSVPHSQKDMNDLQEALQKVIPEISHK